jgi:hypothetical protein
MILYSHIHSHVCPRVPVRQWVLALPTRPPEQAPAEGGSDCATSCSARRPNRVTILLRHRPTTLLPRIPCRCDDPSVPSRPRSGRIEGSDRSPLIPSQRRRPILVRRRHRSGLFRVGHKDPPVPPQTPLRPRPQSPACGRDASTREQTPTHVRFCLTSVMNPM